MNTIKSLTLGVLALVGVAAAGTPSIDLTMDRHANLTRLNDENLASRGDKVGVKATFGAITVKADGLTSGLRFVNPTLTVGMNANLLGMDRIVASYDEQVIGLGLEKSVPVNSLADLNVGVGLARDKNSGMKSIPQGTASVGLSIHVW